MGSILIDELGSDHREFISKDKPGSIYHFTSCLAGSGICRRTVPPGLYCVHLRINFSRTFYGLSQETTELLAFIK